MPLVQAAAGDRLHALAAAPAGGRDRAARRDCPCSPPQANAALSSLRPPAADAARGSARRRARAAGGLPPLAAGARAARPDRARHRLVGADPVRDRDPAQPDVGDARRARDRDLDRVQRAALRALPAGAGGRATSPAGALARTYRSTGAAVLASGITAIAGFGVLVLSSITMLRDFGFVTLIDLTVSLAGVLLVLPAVLVGRRARATLRADACVGAAASRRRRDAACASAGARRVA